MKRHKEGHACYYCGMMASGVDHVIPLVVWKQLGHLKPIEEILAGRILSVPCCRECNLLLGASIQDTLVQRKAELKRRLKQRYTKFLRMPTWTDEEIMVMSFRLQEFIRRGEKIKLRTLQRLRW
jgi:hypothetical protein